MLTIRPSFNEEVIKDSVITNILLYLDYYYKNNKLEVTAVDKHLAYTYQGNFYGLLNELGISPKYYIFILYLNKYTSPYEYDGNKLTIAIPSISLLDNLLNLFR